MTRPAGGKPRYRLRCMFDDYHRKLVWKVYRLGHDGSYPRSSGWWLSSAEAIRRAPR